jgi:hypothetical protein
MKKLSIALVISLLTTSSYASVTPYSCEVNGKTYTMRVDEARKTLEWRGKTYRIIESGSNAGDDCAKYCWVVQGSGVSFTVETATQGVASFTDPITNQDADCEIPQAVYCKGRNTGRCR